MRLLVYGFKPYAHYTENITERVLSRIAETDTVVKKVFDVRFDAEMINRTLLRVKPDWVLGLGQHPRARKLRLERKAINLMKQADQKLVPIAASGPASLVLTLRLPQTALTTVTYDAGTYVCNYSMYLVARYCQQSGAHSGFIHVPKAIDLKLVTAYVQTAMQYSVKKQPKPDFI